MHGSTSAFTILQSSGHNKRTAKCQSKEYYTQGTILLTHVASLLCTKEDSNLSHHPKESAMKGSLLYFNHLVGITVSKLERCRPLRVFAERDQPYQRLQPCTLHSSTFTTHSFLSQFSDLTHSFLCLLLSVFWLKMLKCFTLK